MNKKTINFSILLVLITSLLSIAFIITNFVVELKNGSDAVVTLVFGEIRTVFDLIAEFTAYGIIVFAISTYRLSKAWPAYIIAFSSFAISKIFSIPASIYLGMLQNPGYNLWQFLFSVDYVSYEYSSFLETKLVPILVITIVTYLCTKDYTERIHSPFHFKNPTVKSILISTVIIYFINTSLKVIYYSLALISVGGFSGIYKSDFISSILIPLIMDLIYYLILQYFVVFLVQIISLRNQENIKPKKFK